MYHLSARLRENGWIVPAYSLPPDAEDVHLMRVVVRLDLSRQMIDVLLRDLAAAYAELADRGADALGPTAKPDLWTAPDRSAARSKARTGLAR